MTRSPSATKLPSELLQSPSVAFSDLSAINVQRLADYRLCVPKAEIRRSTVEANVSLVAHNDAAITSRLGAGIVAAAPLAATVTLATRLDTSWWNISESRGYGFTVTITTPCDGTLAENFAVDFPRSFFCHKSRTEADRFGG